MLFHRHKWSDWTITDTGKVKWHGDEVGWYLVQNRYCHSCGKTQVGDQAEYSHAPRAFCVRVSDRAAPVLRKDGVRA